MHKILFVLSFMFVSSCFADDLLRAAGKQTNVEGINIQTIDAPATWSDKAEEVLMQALSLTGIQYKYGGNSPDTGFDCSGFVRYVFSQATKITLPPTARAISQMGTTVKKEELQPGDLVFFNTLKSAFSHVGIYMGNNKFIHSPSAGGKVRVENMDNSYWKKRFNGAQRIEAVQESAN
jgi:cell wall-associated NlpC family hydrolase